MTRSVFSFFSSSSDDEEKEIFSLLIAIVSLQVIESMALGQFFFGVF